MAESEAVVETLRLLESLELPYTVGGSFASGVWGQARYTQDLDVLLDLPRDRVSEMVSAAQDTFLISEDEIQEALVAPLEHPSFQMLHMGEVFKIDVFLPGRDPLRKAELQRRCRVEIGNVSTWVCTAEDIALQKLRWYRLGNRISDRQWNDLVQVIEVQKDKFDRAYFREWADKLGIRELAEEALAEAWD